MDVEKLSEFDKVRACVSRHPAERVFIPDSIFFP